MTISYLHFADYAFLTDNGKIGIIGIFDRIYTKVLPTTHGSMFVVGQVGEIKKEEGLTLVIRKGLQQFFQQPFVTNLQKMVSPLRTYNFLIGLHNFTFPEPGVYDFVLMSGDKEIGIKKLMIEKTVEGN